MDIFHQGDLSNNRSIATQESYDSCLHLSEQLDCAQSLRPQGTICQLETSDNNVKWCLAVRKVLSICFL